jgi:hypothetical protein
MFPTFVWKAELGPEVYKPINDSILRSLGEIGTPLADLVSGESWQSGHGLHELDRFRALVDCINEAAESVLEYLKIGHEPRSQTADGDHAPTDYGTDGREHRASRRQRQGRMLLMFPAWLQHSVDRNRSDRKRISIGFNIMFPAYAELIAAPLWVPGRLSSI